MRHHYRDIRDRIGTDPLWFDEHAVPRYCEFWRLDERYEWERVPELEGTAA